MYFSNILYHVQYVGNLYTTFKEVTIQVQRILFYSLLHLASLAYQMTISKARFPFKEYAPRRSMILNYLWYVRH